MMTAAQIRLMQNPILTNLLLGMGQGTMIAERLFPRLPQALSSVALAKLTGDERFSRFNLRRAPGTPTKRVDIKYEGVTYTVNQYAVEVPMPRELIREADESKKLNVGAHLDVSKIAMATANQILALDYEIEVATLATTTGTYSGNVLALAGGTKWSAATGTPVTDIRTASDVIRKKVGVKPNTLTLSADAKTALITNAEVKTYLPSTQMGPATMEQLKVVLDVEEIVVGEAIWKNAAGVGADVWGNNAILAYVPKMQGKGGEISLAEPAFGFTNVIEGHPFAETPYYENSLKSWVYGATFERLPNVAYATAGYLFTNPK